VKHKPQLVKRKQYIRRWRHLILCLYLEDFKFDLGGDILQVWDDVSKRKKNRAWPFRWRLVPIFIRL
jgi:hypothetical protein